MLASCNDFLDQMPDDRTVVDTEDKISKILVSAYPEFNSIVMAEMASDNAMDNGAIYTIEDKLQEESYLWKDITSVGEDSPTGLWEGCYKAAASANMAIDAIDKLGNPASLQAQRGEALMCRAWAHFQLANIFCLAYNAETAETDLGLPYADKPETEVAPHSERGTLAQLYSRINEDIEEGVKLIDDNIYTVPKYHFNRKAAYAFAARFNLYYQKWDKVIEYATVTLGEKPTNMLRDWASIVNAPSDFGSRCNMYISASEPANLLFQTAYSSMAYWLGPWNLGLRYGHNIEKIAKKETFRAAAGGAWGEAENEPSSWALYLASSCWGMTQKLCISKYDGYFFYTDKVNGVGYRMNNIVALSANETLLCRAEAYIMKGEYDKAVMDINYWLAKNAKGNVQVTKEDIVKRYAGMKSMYRCVAGGPTASPKKPLNPLGIQLADADQENLIQAILHLRRCETMQEGLRWMDIKRWGIEIWHNRDKQSPDSLKLDDPRRAIQLPADVISAGLQPNPRK